jgi:octaprenyl-diphosphate synthase
MEKGVNDDDALAEARRLLDRHGALEETIGRARAFGDTAFAAAASLPPGEAREALIEVVAFCIERIN